MNAEQIAFAEAAMSAHRAMARIARLRLVTSRITIDEFRDIRRRQDQALAERLHTITIKIGA